MSEQKVAWVWLGMKRNQGMMVWFDDTPAESSYGAPYNAWNINEPSKNESEDCAYMD